MSCQTLVWALRQRGGLSAVERVVLMYLADRANSSLLAWPSINTIAEAVELSRRAVQIAVGKLADRGLIRIERRDHQTSNYHILCPAQPAETAPRPAPAFTWDDDEPARPDPAHDMHGGAHDMHPEEPDPAHDMHPGGRILCIPPRAYYAPESLKKESPKESPKTHNARPGARERSRQEPLGFAEWWAAYPRKVARPNAARAYEAALKRGADPGRLLDAMRQYPFPEATRFQPHPATWLNQDRWLDEAEHPDAALMRIVGLDPASASRRSEPLLLGVWQ